ncbi:hypothetical protein [Methylobacterium sp. NEAU K]|uniref:hypothetical protein n=1 Tax=Methylobacterium sp. NEAU K TaxID=3064946 RepID=UPI0027324975|nr:hypothetical protein [Methylobacterium sp. NEAU K]MDP4003455.1 hypothetical protein [Methylobacterium sp. NEAU K]
MTDAGGFEPTEDVSRFTEREQLLHQIAATLQLPLSIFRRPRTSSPTPDGPTAAECSAILAAFARIRDPSLRKQCLAMLERCADA